MLAGAALAGVALTGAAPANPAAAGAADAPPSRRLLFIGGPTLQAWSGVSPELFRADKETRLLTVPDGRTHSMLAALDRVLANYKPDSVLILPESGLGGEPAADTQADLDAMATALRKAGAHVVLAAPLHVGPAAAPQAQSDADRAVTAWMAPEAARIGAVFADFHDATLGPPGGAPPVPLARTADLLARTTLVRGALDMSFRARPGLSGPALQKALAAEQAGQPDTTGSGPYPAIRATEPSLPSDTFYRPANLAPFAGGHLPVLIFGNGGCSNDSGGARPMLTEIASHGYLVIAPGFMKTGPGAYPRPAAPGAVPPGQPLGTSLADLAGALDWATRPTPAGQPWQAFIAPKHIAVAGWSCGGLQALKLAADPRISATVIFDSGIFNPGVAGVPGLPIAKSDLAALHAPVLYVLGGLTDVAYANGSDDYRRLDHVPAVLMSRDVGHGGTFWQPDGGLWAKAATAWLDWHLKGQGAHKQAFVGPDCGFCRDPAWTVSSKGF